MIKPLMGLGLLLLSASVWSQNDPAYDARYRVTFVADWSASTHPVNFPGNPHFSPLIGATHDDETHLWEMGGLSSPGIKLMAETGAVSTLSFEVSDLVIDQQAEQVLSGGGISRSPGSTSLEFNITHENSFVSLVSMIAPSPDWFVGVDALNLRSNGQWQEMIAVDLHAYDAGTDSGVSYTSSNQVTNPPEVIRPITGTPFDVNPVLGQFVFELLETQGNFPLAGEHSGLYFIPENSGDGVNLIISEGEENNTVLVTWYTYRDGQQMWLVGSTGFLTGDTEVTISMFRTSGGQFGDDFNADDVEVTPWGSVSVSIPTCGHMNMAFEGTENIDEFGTAQYTQLTGVGDLRCE